MSSANILFFSNHCEGSKHLVALLKSENLNKYFHFVCVDNNPKVPPQVKVTPTLIIHGVPTPYVANDAFAWLAKVKQWKSNVLMQKVNTEQQKYLQNINSNLSTGNTNLLGFNQSEMNGMSDIFSFFSRNMQQECQDSFPQSYFTINNMGNDTIFTPPQEEVKITPQKQKETMVNLEKSRKLQDNEIKQNIENFKKQYDR